MSNKMKNSDVSSSMSSSTTPIKTSSGISGPQSSEITTRGMTPPQTSSTPAPASINSIQQQQQGSFYGSQILTVTPPNSAGLKVPCKFLESHPHTSLKTLFT